MSHKIILILLTLFASYSKSATEGIFNVADVARQTGVLTDNFKAKKSSLSNGQGLSISFSSMSKTRFSAYNETGEYNSGNFFGFGYRSQYANRNEVNVSWGLSLELINNYQSITINDVTYKSSNMSNQNLVFMAAEPNLTYGVTDTVYLLGGVNLAYPITKNILSTDLEPNWGYQMGAGIKLSAWNLEGVYRQINFSASRSANSEMAVSSRSLNSFDHSGVMLRATYIVE